jgi:hypothetical protein
LQGFLVKRWKLQLYSTAVEHVDERFRIRFLERNLDRGEFCSGDYSSATDQMHMDVTVAALCRILENLGLERTLVGVSAWNSLIGSMIKYPDGKIVRQTNGQLMGHPLSFPILCMINLSTYMRATQISSWMDLVLEPLLINGDDILFRGDQELFSRWKSCAGDVGLVVNDLKTYRSKHWALINSRMYHSSGQRCGYFNTALALGFRVKSESLLSLRSAPMIWEEVSGYVPDDVGRAARRLLLPRILSLTDRIKSRIEGGTFSPNLFLPRRLGGVGLRNFADKPFGISEAQRRVATFCLRNPLEGWLVEKFDHTLPYACTLAVRKFRKLKPALEPLALERFGPLRKSEDWESVADGYFGMCMRASAWAQDPERTYVNGEDGRKIYSDRPSLEQVKAAPNRRLTRGNVTFVLNEAKNGIEMFNHQRNGASRDALILKLQKKALRWHEPPVRERRLRWLIDHPPRFAIVGTGELYRALPSHSFYSFES